MLGQLPDSLELSPTETPTGKLTVLDASTIPAKARHWVLINPPPDYDRQTMEQMSLADGRLVFSTGTPGVYYFVLAFIPDEGGDGGNTVHQIVHSLKVGDGVSPLPGPFPKPTPEPILPEGKYKLALLSRAEALKRNDPETAGTIATVYRSIASQISRGQLKSEEGRFGESIEQSTRNALLTALSSGKMDEWRPWGLAVSSRINELVKVEKTLTTDADYLTAYVEIATGLESLSVPDDDNQPNPDPIPQKKVAWVVVVEETKDRNPTTARVLSNFSWWKSLEGKGLKWRHYDDDSEDTEPYLEVIDRDNLPQVILMEEDGSFIRSFKMPDTTEQLEKEIGVR